ncbi:hypothetical protein GCM10011316_32150 [Roseibium aquae]|uniref:Uncharacterized protein n=1 Tax=Roseibium aquae TaxID=1323746 RepID=A0A916TMJ7_9HYPH|nr:DUF1186 domain-containing protein [Roseibium aquae]GGB57663.1 hypothetical protein GCM10011316_32150 [Roseibium aquae]
MTMDRAKIIADLSERALLPWATLNACLADHNRSETIFVNLLHRVQTGPELDTDEERALFYGIHILAAQQTETALTPLIEILQNRREETDRILGDEAIGETLPRLLMALGSGKGALYWDIATGSAADWLIRDAFFKAWTYEVLSRRISRRTAQSRLQRLPKWMSAPADSPLWMSWMNVIADLGMTGLLPEIDTALRSGRAEIGTLAISDRDYQDVRARAQANTQHVRHKPEWRARNGFVPFGQASALKYDFYRAALVAPGTTEDVSRNLISQAAEEAVTGFLRPSEAGNENTPRRRPD